MGRLVVRAICLALALAGTARAEDHSSTLAPLRAPVHWQVPMPRGAAPNRPAYVRNAASAVMPQPGRAPAPLASAGLEAGYDQLFPTPARRTGPEAPSELSALPKTAQ